MVESDTSGHSGSHREAPCRLGMHEATSLLPSGSLGVKLRVPVTVMLPELENTDTATGNSLVSACPWYADSGCSMQPFER